MYGHTYSKSIDQPGEVADPARGQLAEQAKRIFPCPRSCSTSSVRTQALHST